MSRRRESGVLDLRPPSTPRQNWIFYRNSEFAPALSPLPREDRPVAFGNQVAIREELLERVYPLLEKHRGKIVTLGYDIQLQTLPMQGNVSYSWVLIVLCSGALIGPQHYLSYTYTLGQNPQVPDDRTLEAAVIETYSRLGIMQVRQVQAQAPPALGGTTNN